MEVCLTWQGKTLQVKPSEQGWQQLQEALALFTPDLVLARS